MDPNWGQIQPLLGPIWTKVGMVQLQLGQSNYIWANPTAVGLIQLQLGRPNYSWVDLTTAGPIQLQLGRSNYNSTMMG